MLAIKMHGLVPMVERALKIMQFAINIQKTSNQYRKNKYITKIYL